MDQDEPRSPSSGRESERNPRPKRTDPDARARDPSSPGTRSVAPDIGGREAGGDLSSSSPKPGRPADRDRSWRRNETSPSRITGRIVEVRRDLYGDEGIPAIADALKLPHRTWMNYETGVVMPGTVLLFFLDLTMVDPHWLFTGRGPKYQGPRGRFARPTRDERALHEISRDDDPRRS